MKLIEVQAAKEFASTFLNDIFFKMAVNRVLDAAPTVEAVPLEQYNALLERYNDLRQDFVDYVCSGEPTPAPSCKNKNGMCVNGWGHCLPESGNCQGFNPDGGTDNA